MDTVNNEEQKRGPGRPKGVKDDVKKMTKSEVNYFISESVKKIMDEHLSHKEYIRWCKKNQISRSMANVYWKRAWETIQQKYELERNKQVTKHLRKYWILHDEALQRGDINNARMTLNDIAKLMGLNEPDKVETSESITFNFGTDEETD